MVTKKPKILLIGTGGAISAKLVKGQLKYGEIVNQELVDMMPSLKDHFDITTTNLFRMDSADIKPEQWPTLANAIYYKMQEFDGIVVTMGTDTLAYAASAISFLIQQNNIPIVFTGSQIEPMAFNTDARVNLRDAITVAAKADIAETVIVFNGKIMRACRTKKVNTAEFDSFKSFEVQMLGKIEDFLRLKGVLRKRNNSKPIIFNNFETVVATMKVYPGFDGWRIKLLIDYHPKGIVIEGFGLGNLPLLDNTVKEGIKYANSNNVPIILASNAKFGEYWQDVYESEMGERLKGIKIIPVYDMLPETAYVKLMWVLGQTSDFAKVKEMMQHSYCGEVTAYKKPKTRKA